MPGDSTFMSHADVVDEVEFLKSRGSIVPIELKEGLQKLKPVSFFLANLTAYIVVGSL